MFDDEVLAKARAVLDACRRADMMLATAESCTGGLVSGALTAILGSSEVVERGFVTYSYDSKSEILGVPAAMIAEHGAVSEAVARAMAEGALARAGPTVGVAVAITGVAGPGSDSERKPAGRVHFAAALKDGTVRHRRCDFGDIGRDAVRRASVLAAFDLILEALG